MFDALVPQNIFSIFFRALIKKIDYSNKKCHFYGKVCQKRHFISKAT